LTTAHASATLAGAPPVGFGIGIIQAATVHDCSCGEVSSLLYGAAGIRGNAGLQILGTGSGRLARRLGTNVNVSTVAGKFWSGGSTLLLKGLYRTQSGGSSTGSWAPRQTGFAGFRFLTNTTTPNAKTDYGWIRLSYDVSANGVPVNITALDWAYASDGAPIVTPTPEPATGALSMLALGAAAVAAA